MLNWTWRVRGSVIGFGLAAMLCAAPASADGVVLKPSQIPAAQRSSLTASIQAARTSHPKSFEAVRSVANRTEQLDARKRGRLAPMGQQFEALGPNALMPMLEMVAFDAPPRGSLRDSAWVALRAGLIEAIGSHRDPRSRAVLHAILQSNETEFHTLRAAAEAVGNLGDDVDATLLANLASQPGAKQRAIVAGMGSCRRTAAANALAKVIASNPADETLLSAIRAMGDMGSSWAWKTPAVRTHAAEESATRSTAAKALMNAFVARESVRSAASNALMMVDDPSTPQLIAQARQGASADLNAALDKLAARFANNPAR